VAQLNHVTHFTGPGSGTSFTVTIPATAAGSTLICVSTGMAAVTAHLGSTGGTAFTKRTTSTGVSEVAAQDITDSSGGTTTIGITLSGAENVDGVIYEFAAGQLSFASGNSINPTGGASPDVDNLCTAGTLTTTGRAVILSAYIHTDAVSNYIHQFWGLEPLGKISWSGFNSAAGATTYWSLVGLSDQASAGNFTPKTSIVNTGGYQAACWAYTDSSAVASYANPYPNAIAAENSLPGSIYTSWFGITTNANIAGYTGSMSYAAGDTVDFKVDSGNNAFTIDIFRIGFYNYEVFGARRYATITGSPAAQPAPTIDSYGATVCAWSTTATWNIPADLVPGVYIANIRRSDTPAHAHNTIFVVRTPKPAARQNQILIKTSEFTWQAYNIWGNFGEDGGTFTGRSVYGQGSAEPFTLAKRSFAVSFDRPFSVQTSDDITSFYDSEISLINFLEGNAFDLAYTTMIDIEKDPTLPNLFKCVVSSSHDEYWSTNQRDAFENARDQGVNLAFFSSNESLWHVRFDPADSGKREMICYKDSWDTTGWDNTTKYDPVEFTGTWRDSRTTVGGVNNQDRRPESGMSGQWFIGNATVSASMMVPFAYKDLPIWRHTAITSLTSGNSQTLQPAGLGTGVIGDEVDYVNNSDSSTPKNLVLLQSQNLALNAQVADINGVTYNGTGTYLYGMSLYMAPSGALVFGAGTWRWACGISRFRLSMADIQNNIDPVMQQATLNLFADLGVPPAAVMTTQANFSNTPLVDPGPAQGAAAYGLQGLFTGWGLPVK
jgi:hypothetical protein